MVAFGVKFFEIDDADKDEIDRNGHNHPKSMW